MALYGSLFHMCKIRTAIVLVVFVCSAASLVVPLRADTYDDTVLADHPWAYWRL
eukprot:CAMPEP_0196750350 /NCGR_PEP_ID=MMETSP1091-20130531/80279_1 /TAXON_ID=302021 /ORGANISM="Rhodomonas sp., Strain CCMP768" /LENGTH=53 /DNA_ID=CAMNT_0042097961 /DNA_START=161 /DNA_END=319 /DNA_ORIENTATION=+